MKGTRTLLWILATLLMLGAAVFQRRTGPTYAMRGEYEIAGQDYEFRLVRSGVTSRDALVEIPAPVGDVQGQLHFKRYGTADEFTALAMQAEEDVLSASLPKQPAAGKLEYYVKLDTPEGSIRIPETSGENPIIRFKDDVPLELLLPHVVLMFAAMLLGVRAGLSALFDPRDMRVLAWLSLGLMTIGGLALGPLVQHRAFGSYWTGFPFGYDLTDNKTLLMWLAFAGACTILGFRSGRREGLRRLSLAVATVVMMGAYLIPHSLRGSELDYSQLDEGVPPSEAIETGRR
jgi:hypothetical protein